jgi:elongation factor 1-beta
VLTLHCSDSPSQADVAVFKAFQAAPDAEKYPHAARWYKHIASYEAEFSSLPGDASKEYSTYGPETSEVTVNPAAAPAAEEDDDDVDLFGSDDEEEDEEAARVREERLAEYKKKKEGKTKPAAKSIVTMDVKPWGMYSPFLIVNLIGSSLQLHFVVETRNNNLFPLQTTRPT